jgi:hypothetical protein
MSVPIKVMCCTLTYNYVKIPTGYGPSYALPTSWILKNEHIQRCFSHCQV